MTDVHHEPGAVLELEDGQKFVVGQYKTKESSYTVDVEDSMGMVYMTHEGAFYIFKVLPGLPGERAGVPVGCVLVSVNGISTADEDPVAVMSAARNQGTKTVEFIVHHEVGYVTPRGAGEEALGADRDGIFGRTDDMTDENLQELMPFVEQMFQLFDHDRDGLLSYVEYYDMMMALELQPPSQEDFDNDFTTGPGKGFGKLQFAVDLYSIKDKLNVLEDKVARHLTGPDDGQSSYFTFDEYDSESSFLSKSAQSVQGARETLDFNRNDYPSVWKGQRYSHQMKSSSIVFCDLRSDPNEQLKRVLLQCGRELERRQLECKEAHDIMEHGLIKVNREAKKEFGHDLNTLLSKPSTHRKANEWAARKMREIQIPPTALHSYKQHRAKASMPPPTPSSLSSAFGH
eukprot:TRINITY_DN10364_c0_g5_i1.p1 TRINITY_DN10364_c0_g5~~TRINITY_DN10364_c0_g5_i1.p1  ORF type:complete len:401 (+),score=66.42 TRINITY_DN10364_c0_g5_i1:223-1425(+)